MTAASGGPGEKPDYEGQPPNGFGIPPVDPAYGGWQPAVSGPTAAAYPPPGVPAAGYGGGYPPPPAYPPFPGYRPQYGPPTPGGYGYPGHPGGYSHPDGYGYPGYPVVARAGTNVLAIISLVSSVSGLLCFLGSLAGIITGAIAIAQVKRTGDKGFGLAVAGTAAGVAGLLVYLVMVAYALQHR